jgi:flagellar protein FlaG
MSSNISAVNSPRPVASADAAAHAAAPKGGPSAHPVETEDKTPAVKFELKEMRENIADALQKLNEQMRSKGRDLNFSMDEASDRVVITVKHSQTGEIVRQIPNEVVLKVAHNLEQVKGMLLNEKT